MLGALNEESPFSSYADFAGADCICGADNRPVGGAMLFTFSVE
jgi:hypothetical protein